MRIYTVKSKSNVFPEFTIKDDERGYLISNVFEKIPVLMFGEIGKLIGYRGKTSDILIQPQNSKKWYSIKYIRGSSEAYLEHCKFSNSQTKHIERIFVER